jgi:N-acetylglucosaminylphosphatidylinositol deacetylase
VSPFLQAFRVATKGSDIEGRHQIVTFDAYGVSGHANHRALYESLRCVVFSPLAQSSTEVQLSSKEKVPPIRSDAVRRDQLSVPIYSVRSASVIAKYTSLALLPFALVKHLVVSISSPAMRSSSLFVSSVDTFALARESFAAHESQARWFRTLFVNASRYLWYVQVDRVR